MHTGLTCVCLLVLFTLGVNGVLQEKMNGHHNGHRRHHGHHKLKERLNRHHFQQSHSLIESKAQTKTMPMPAPAPTDNTVAPSIYATAVVPTATDIGSLLDAYTELEGRVDYLEEGQKDPAQNGADIATAQRHAVDMIHAAQEAVAQEQAANAAATATTTVSALERSEKVSSTKHTATKKTAVKVATKTATKTESTKAASKVVATTNAKTAAKAKVHTKLTERLKQKVHTHQHQRQHQKAKVHAKANPLPDAACCADAQDSVARADNVANVNSITDLKVEVERLTQELTVAKAVVDAKASPPSATAQSNAAQTQNAGAGTGAGSTTSVVPSLPTSTGSAAECNGHINLDTAKGDKDIWKEEDAAQQAALSKILKKIAPQISPSLATDDKVLNKGADLLTHNTAKHVALIKEITDTCAEATCDSGTTNAPVEADTSVTP